jgi:tetratricopeptide (TPR) repeat protein
LSGNRWNEAYALGSRYRVLVQRGEFRNAIEGAGQTIGLSRQAGLLIMEPLMSIDLAWMYATLGSFERALALCEPALALAAQMPPMMSSAVLSVRARIHARRGDLPAAEADLTAARTGCDPTDYTTDVPIYVARAAAELAMAQGDPAVAAGVLAPVVADVSRIGVRYYLPSLLHGLGLARLAQGQLDEAQAALSQARAEAEAMGAQAALWPVLAALGALAMRRGDRREAEALRGRARGIIARLATGLTDAEVRDAFSALPEVRELGQDDA